MRFRKIFPCDPKSSVQITNTVTTKQMIRDHFSGKSVSLPTGVDSRSFDFPDGKVDFDATSINEAPDLIEQSFMKDRFYKHLHPDSSSEPVETNPTIVEE